MSSLLASATMAVANASATAGPKAQAGILEGLNPIAYDKKSPINLFIIQAVIIIIFCRLLHYPLSLLGQPRVIAEVLGGIILGPSVMMRIPGFQEHIFPADSMPVLNNAANVGLILFLFLVGLEVDTRLFKTNWRVALSVGAAGMIIPFGLGYAIAYGLFNEYGKDTGMAHINFATFGLFIGTALSITAFPVLCRILSELQLLQTPVGVTVLAAGIGNDVTGWVLLALSVALVNNATGLSALYVFLTAVAWVLFLTLAFRPAFVWILRRNGSFQNGPGPGMVAFTLLAVLISAWFTAAIGVHAIFGAFLIGIICPHEGGFAIKLTEKIEDLISALFVPLYFALSGLSTNLGLLNDGKAWGYVIAIISIAFVGKISGGMLAARACRLLWRESMTIGVLMSCKGLVELIVLNIGLQARILSEKTFTMFVVMALVTTVATTPLANLFYPISYRKKVERWKRGEIDWEGNALVSEAHGANQRVAKTYDRFQTSRLLVNLRLDTLKGLFNLIAILGDARKPEAASPQAPPPETRVLSSKPLEVRGMRLLELTDRTSSVMQSAELDESANHDSVIAAFESFAQWHGLAVAGHLTAVAQQHYAPTLAEHAQETGSDLMVIPWSANGSLSEDRVLGGMSTESVSFMDRFLNRQHIDFVESVFEQATCSVGVFISRDEAQDGSRSKRKMPPMLARAQSTLSVKGAVTSTVAELVQPGEAPQRFVLPYIGGSDDQAALLFVLQLAHSAKIEVIVVHVVFTQEDAVGGMRDDGEGSSKENISEEVTASDLELLSSSRRTVETGSLSARVRFTETIVDKPSDALEEAVRQAGEHTSNGDGAGVKEDIVVVGRRHQSWKGRNTYENGLDIDFQRTVGVLGDALIRGGIDAGLWVMQARKSE